MLFARQAMLMIVADIKFNEPRIALNRIYTKGGDKGQTSLVGGERVAKDSDRIACYGTVDELNAFLGIACVSAHESVAPLVPILLRVQHELFNLGSILATPAARIHPKQARVTSAEIEQLEKEIDRMNEELPDLRSFVLPGGSRISAELHACRTICRRAERLAVKLARQEDIPAEVVQYLNRLSDALFVWSRWVNHYLKAGEVLWDPNLSASGQH